MNELMTLRVVLVEDDGLVRAGLADWLASFHSIQIVGQYENADQALSSLSNDACDIVLVDVLLPGVTGIDLVKKLRDKFPKLTCVMLSGNLAPELVIDSFKAGACGFLPKKMSPDELQLALAEIMNGNWYLSPSITKSVISKTVAYRESLASTDSSTIGELSDRERELLRLIAEGHTFQQISDRLAISSRTVERMKSKLQEKIGADNLADLIRRAVKMNLVVQ